MSSHPIPLDAEMRAELYEALWPTDRWGEPRPKRLGLHSLTATAIQGGVRTRLVPPEYWRKASDLEHHALAVVDCLCGQVVIVELGVVLKSCPGCQRWYFYAGGEVLALNSPPGVP